MLEKITNALSIAKEKVTGKTFSVVDNWLQIFPDLEDYGFTIKSFGVTMSISPVLDVQMSGKADEFTEERLEQILDEVKGNRALSTIFRTVLMTYDWRERAGIQSTAQTLFIKLAIGVSPQVMVSWQ